MSNIFINDTGHKVVEIDSVIFSGKRRIDWKGKSKCISSDSGVD